MKEDDGDDQDHGKHPNKPKSVPADRNSSLEVQGESIPNIQHSTSERNVEESLKPKSKSQVRHKVEDYDMVVGRLKDATSSFKEAIVSISKRAHEIKDKAGETFIVGAKRDAKEIRALGAYAENVVRGYEDTMTEINKRNYADQEKLLKGYKKLLEEQINLISARIELVKRLKSPED
jgi:hypothetical protein